MANYLSKKLRKVMCIIAVQIFVLTLAGCIYGAIERLPKEELFTLQLGKMEDQLDLFHTGNIARRNSFYMRDGLFYIANGNSLKVMQFTSFGDLLLLLYNSDPEINPQTIMPKSEEIEEKVANKIASSFEFQNIGLIASDSDAGIYVEDRVQKDQIIEDKNQGVNLSSRIYRFNRQGKLIDILGQEGIGGTPFPYIVSILITKKNEPVVICMVPNGYIIFWYTKEGSLSTSLRFDMENLPKESNFFPSCEKIQPDLKERLLYFQISFFAEEIDEDTKTKSTIKDSMTRVYTYDMDAHKFDGYFTLPESGKIKVQNGGNEIEIPGPAHELLGITENGYFFFLRPDGINDMRLLILDRRGREFKAKILNIDDTDKSELFYKYLHMSDTGIISAFLCFKESAKVVWWRTDKLVGAEPDADE